jgi:hypothetical protein
MSEKKSVDKGRQADLQAVDNLIRAADIDTAFRDRYLQRARERLSSLVSKEEYERLKTPAATLDQLMQETQRAVARQNWNRVEDLSTEILSLQGALKAKQADLPLADKVYGAPDVAIDPFSSGLDVLLGRAGQAKEALRQELIKALSALEKTDLSWGPFFAARCSDFSKLSFAGQAADGTESGGDIGKLQKLAAEAAHAGQVDELKRIAQEIQKAHQSEKPKGPAAERKAEVKSAVAYPSELGEPFPSDAVTRGQKLGLSNVQLKIQLTALPKLAQDTFERYGWHPSFPSAEVARNGEMYLRPLLEKAEIPKEIVEPLVETALMFALHPFVNSGGVRYFPLYPDNEVVLIEDFPEDPVPTEPSELLKVLGLTRRSGLSRGEIESRLRENGETVIQGQLGLDPIKFRLVCVPYDVYARLGLERKWGQQPRWTHVDGYQILKEGSIIMRPLLAGDVRFGGLFDLCSISRNDEREGVLARFAVIHRERLMVR